MIIILPSRHTPLSSRIHTVLFYHNLPCMVQYNLSTNNHLIHCGVLQSAQYYSPCTQLWTTLFPILFTLYTSMYYNLPYTIHPCTPLCTITKNFCSIFRENLQILSNSGWTYVLQTCQHLEIVLSTTRGKLVERGGLVKNKWEIWVHVTKL